MCIIINNTGGDMAGICTYEVRINNELIATFEHAQPDGLSECLYKAGLAVSQQVDNSATKASDLLEYVLENVRLRKALEVAWDAMRERRDYAAPSWDWKYGKEWDKEDKTVKCALKGGIE